MFRHGAGDYIGDVFLPSEDLQQPDAGQDEEAGSVLEYWQLADAPSTDDWLEDLPAGPWKAREESHTSMTAASDDEPSGDEDVYEHTDCQAEGACKLMECTVHLR